MRFFKGIAITTAASKHKKVEANTTINIAILFLIKLLWGIGDSYI
jgi:hypothetical protein